MNLCQYKSIFGEPNQGLHSIRVFNIAIVDVIMTIIGAYYISQYFKYDFKLVLVVLFLFGIVAHKIFCVDTTINKLLFDK